MPFAQRLLISRIRRFQYGTKFWMNAGFPILTNFATSFSDSETPSVNCNGGLYLIPAPHFKILRQAWPHWAAWLINNSHLLTEKYLKHVDQVSFGLACLEMDLPIDHLSLAENYPTHEFVKPKPDIAPSVIHYHSHVDPSHLLSTIGQTNVDREIQKVNRVIRRRRRLEFDNRPFWNYRYSEHPELGSGIGSRKQSLAAKRACISQLNQDVQPASVLDIGCGDLEVFHNIAFENYTGLDVSEEALRMAKRKRSDWNFVHGDLVASELEPRDLVLCFDVLIHQPSYVTYLALLGRLISLADKNLVISGYNQRPWNRSEITFYYEPLSKSLLRLAPGAEIQIIGGYRDTTIIRVDIDNPCAFREQLFRTHSGMFWSRPDDLISEQFLHYGGHTRSELAMLVSLVSPGDRIIDLGAHIGSFSIPLAKAVGKDGHLICVEPDAVNATRLAQNLILNSCDAQTSLRDCLVGPESRYRYIEAHGNTGAGYFSPDHKGTFANTVSLDSLCSDEAPDLIKIDVEGMELQVLRSGEATIDTCRPLLYIEISAAQLLRSGNSVEELESWLQSKKYRTFRNTSPRNSDNDDFAVAELKSLVSSDELFDCLAVPAERVADLARLGKIPAEFDRSSNTL